MRRLLCAIFALCFASGSIVPSALAACCAPAQRHGCCAKAQGRGGQDSDETSVKKASCCRPGALPSFANTVAAREPAPPPLGIPAPTCTDAMNAPVPDPRPFAGWVASPLSRGLAPPLHLR